MGILPGRTERFEAFIAPARRRPGALALALGAGLAAASWLRTRRRPAPPRRRPAPRRAPILLYLASFAGLAAGVALAARLLQRRAPGTLIGPGGFRPGAFALGVAVVAAARRRLRAGPLLARAARAADAARRLGGLAAAGAAGAPRAVRRRGGRLPRLPDAGPRRPLPLAARLVAAARGALRPAALEPGRARPRTPGSRSLATTVVGLVLADVTARTGNLSAAIGLHFANNVVALLVVAVPSPVSGARALAVCGRPGRRRRDAPAAPARPRRDPRSPGAPGARPGPAAAIAFGGSGFYLGGQPPPRSRPAHELDLQLRPPEDQLALLPARGAREPLGEVRQLRHDAVPPRARRQPQRLHQLRPPPGDQPARPLPRAVRRRRLRRGAGAEAADRPARLQGPEEIPRPAARGAQEDRRGGGDAGRRGRDRPAEGGLRRARTSPSWAARWACTSATPSSPPPSAR